MAELGKDQKGISDAFMVRFIMRVWHGAGGL
jgi:hypothetical protein